MKNDKGETICDQCGSSVNVREYERTEGKFYLHAMLCDVDRAEHDARMDKLAGKAGA